MTAPMAAFPILPEVLLALCYLAIGWALLWLSVYACVTLHLIIRASRHVRAAALARRHHQAHRS